MFVYSSLLLEFAFIYSVTTYLNMLKLSVNVLFDPIMLGHVLHLFAFVSFGAPQALHAVSF